MKFYILPDGTLTTSRQDWIEYDKSYLKSDEVK